MNWIIVIVVCRGDWLLKFLFRTANVHFSTVAGLGPVKWNNRRMHNIDLSDVVSQSAFKSLSTCTQMYLEQSTGLIYPYLYLNKKVWY